MKQSIIKIKALPILLGGILRCSFPRRSSGFLVASKSVLMNRRSYTLQEQVSTNDAPPSSVFDNIISDLHSSAYPFRIIVISNGAILETTSTLGEGTSLKTSKSPKTGEQIVTFASPDKSFEFHLKVDQISKVSFHKVQRGEEGKVMRICRMMDRTGSLATSLILQAVNDDDHLPVLWFDGMIQRYGETVEL
jgi:hypothetical protein